MPEATLTSELSPLNDAGIFVDDNRETMIKVDHVTMEFNMASEQLNSLKEYAIAIAKRKLYFEKFTALDDISFEVKKGDVFGILGTNGSGKSTLLKIIAGVLEPTKGSCEINGNIAPLIELGAGFDMELSARENIYLNGSLLGYSKTFIEEHFSDIVEFAEIEKFLDMPMKNYSSGMIARIAFAIATVIVPEILIVDEVLSVGDFMFQQKCENRINDLIENHGVTVLIVSHSNDQIERLCNKAIWIEKGHTRILGDATKVCNAYRILGGRTGSAESEAIVYRALQNAEQSDSIIPHKTIAGANHYEIAINATKDAWPLGVENILLVQDNAHVFSIAASGIAGALNASLIPFDIDNLSEEYVALISGLNASKVYIVANSEMIAKTINNSLLAAYNLKLSPIECQDGCLNIMKSILKYGISSELWNSNIAFLGHFDDAKECFALSTLSYAKNCPFLIIGSKENEIDNEVSDLLKDANIDTIYTFLHTSDHPYTKSALNRGFDIRNIDIKNDRSLEQWVASNFDTIPQRACFASGQSSQWQSLITLPSFCGKKKMLPLLVQTDSLDNTASLIQFFSNSQINYVDILGNNAIPDIYLKLVRATNMPL